MLRAMTMKGLSERRGLRVVGMSASAWLFGSKGGAAPEGRRLGFCMTATVWE
jgi:hypothetical protein